MKIQEVTAKWALLTILEKSMCYDVITGWANTRQHNGDEDDQEASEQAQGWGLCHLA